MCVFSCRSFIGYLVFRVARKWGEKICQSCRVKKKMLDIRWDCDVSLSVSIYKYRCQSVSQVIPDLALVPLVCSCVTAYQGRIEVC